MNKCIWLIFHKARPWRLWHNAEKNNEKKQTK